MREWISCTDAAYNQRNHFYEKRCAMVSKRECIFLHNFINNRPADYVHIFNRPQTLFILSHILKPNDLCSWWSICPAKGTYNIGLSSNQSKHQAQNFKSGSNRFETQHVPGCLPENYNCLYSVEVRRIQFHHAGGRQIFYKILGPIRMT